MASGGRRCVVRSLFDSLITRQWGCMYLTSCKAPEENCANENEK